MRSAQDGDASEARAETARDTTRSAHMRHTAIQTHSEATSDRSRSHAQNGDVSASPSARVGS